MRALIVVGLMTVCACRFSGAQSYYGRAENDMNFGEVDFVLIEEEGSWLEVVPFVVFGEGTLPDEYGPGSPSYVRSSFGDKVRLRAPFKDGKFAVYVEAGAMISYYSADEIGTPFEFEGVVGVGAQFEFGDGWWMDLAVRARHPMGNGDRHDEPEHAPHGTQSEIVFGVKKDF